jgi:hypothetical protein
MKVIYRGFFIYIIYNIYNKEINFQHYNTKVDDCFTQRTQLDLNCEDKGMQMSLTTWLVYPKGRNVCEVEREDVFTFICLAYVLHKQYTSVLFAWSLIYFVF